MEQRLLRPSVPEALQTVIEFGTSYKSIGILTESWPSWLVTCQAMGWKQLHVAVQHITHPWGSAWQLAYPAIQWLQSLSWEYHLLKFSTIDLLQIQGSASFLHQLPHAWLGMAPCIIGVDGSGAWSPPPAWHTRSIQHHLVGGIIFGPWLFHSSCPQILDQSAAATTPLLSLWLHHFISFTMGGGAGLTPRVQRKLTGISS